MGWRRTPLLRALLHALAAGSTLLVGVLAASHADLTAVVLVSAAALLAVVVALRLTSARTASGDPAGVGRRARAHRQSLDSTPEPQHPDTAGRPRTRAPARPLAAA